jgi:hypothetical protein
VVSDALLDPAGLSTEAALVMCCATTAASAARTTIASELARRVGDWDRVLDVAKRHAVLPLVHRYLNLECESAIPKPALAKLRTQWQLIILYNRHLTAELVRLLDLLEQAGIAAITFKGPVLASTAYGSIELRQFSDLDILVHQRDLPQIAEVLTAERYVSPHTRREGLATGYFQEYEDAFIGPDGLGSIDVHWNITPRSFRFAPDEEGLWRRARRVDLGVGTVMAMGAEDLMLYICVHAAKHGWVTLGWICDVAESIRAHPGIDLMEILAKATALGSRRMFLTGIHLARELVGAPVPDEIAAVARGDRAVAALTKRIAGQLFSGTTQGRADFDPWAVPMRSIEGTRERVRYVVRRMLAPTMGDYQLVPLPKALFPLYWVIRPFRMTVQYGPRLLRGKLQAQQHS